MSLSDILRKIDYKEFLVLGVAAAITIVFILYAVLRDQDGGRLSTEFEGKTYLMHWHESVKLPIPVLLDSSTDVDGKIKFAVAAATYNWNEVLGHKVFHLQSMDPDEYLDQDGFSLASVVIKIDDANSPKINAKSTFERKSALTILSFTPTAQVTSAQIVLDDMYDDKQLYSIFMHELGHVLCLEHDYNSDSVMHINRGSRIEPSDIKHAKKALGL